MRTAREQGPWPGLILEWQRTNAGGWRARVVYAASEREPIAVQAWFVAELLRPVSDTVPT